MGKVLMVFIFLVAVPFISFAQMKHSPYAGQERREIKALSQEDIEGYLRGRGMGFAKAGELNHYPGPKHVLELAEKLHLSKGQIEKTREVYGEMHEEAVSIGEVMVEKEKILDRLFADQKIDEKTLLELASEIGRLKGKLRAVHLKAHLKMKKILSPHQVERYDELRGYQGSGENHNKQHHDSHGSHN